VEFISCETFNSSILRLFKVYDADVNVSLFKPIVFDSSNNFSLSDSFLSSNKDNITVSSSPSSRLESSKREGNRWLIDFFFKSTLNVVKGTDNVITHVPFRVKPTVTKFFNISVNKVLISILVFGHIDFTDLVEVKQG